ncbi:hypothetical protein GJ744_003463 [Endocarpon pusillum]|uniref:DUF7082 domain-containing protein n=1 Tax=Endocarpon pusillum TaxID=364733 RepID=A0A8H7ARN8_9EURO|nr:hypothetical protein GJ744_003463 [Endocarpon pusillum]
MDGSLISADFQTPLIFDETFGLPDSAGPLFGEECSDGLSAKSASFFSMMSGYEKPQPGDLLEYGTSGALHDPAAFGPFAQPQYAPQLLYSSSVADNNQDAGDSHYGPGTNFPGQQQVVEDSGIDILDQRFRQFPQITSCSPLQGLEGSTISISMQSADDLRTSPAITFTLAFASKRVECALQLLSDPNVSPKQYLISAEVPPFTSTGWHALEVPLHIMMEIGNNVIPRPFCAIGPFRYANQIISQVSPRKRRLSSDSEDAAHHASKKSSVHQGQPERSSENRVYNTSPYSPFVSTPVVGSLSHNGNAQGNSPGVPGHKYSASIASAASVKAQSPQTPPSWSPSFTPVNAANGAPKSSATPSQASTVDAPTAKTPALIRTSTIQQASASMSSAAPSHSFNPYSMYPSKAVLKLNGELDSMVEGWTIEEWEAKRRLVQFTRRQNQSTIHADFKAVAPEDRQPNSICISCIWWDEKKDYYVTSVDTIFLLESLVAVRFTVEEKNRIRRNLEGFRPLTVSKSKPDSEEFFKVIMGFPSPKPRNIEKDVKVFPWKILAHALKKIIGKYSASYSSTASALPTPMNSHYTSNGASDSGTDVRASASPQLNGLNRGASPYPMSTASFSPHSSQQRVSVAITSGPPTDLRLQVHSIVPGYSYPATHSHPQMSQYPQALRSSSQPMTAPPASGRGLGSWENGGYSTFESGGQNPSAANINAFNYNRVLDMPTSQAYMPATSYPLSHSGP